jgi:signal transduction histidine kinase
MNTQGQIAQFSENYADTICPQTILPVRLRQFFLRYGVPLISVCAAIIATVVLTYIIKESRSSSVFFLAAIMASAWYGGLTAGFLATALSVVSIDFFFIKPLTAYGVTVYDVPLIIVFCLLAVIISYLVDFRRRAENQLRRSNEELEQRVIERTRELADANRTKDEFLAMVTHDLRAPLTSILGWVEIMEQDGIESDSAARAVAVIKRNAIAQQNLVSDLMSLTRMEAEGIKLNVQPVDLPQLFDTARLRFGPMIAAKNISLESSIARDLPLIDADSERIAQVLDNLLSNAVKFTPAGGRIEVSLIHRDNGVQISVSDNGAGIDSDLLPDVFERFRQGDESRHQGLGLGLFIVKCFVEAHGGTVEVESHGRDKGSTFTVKLPCNLVDFDETTIIQKPAAKVSNQPSLPALALMAGNGSGQ